MECMHANFMQISVDLFLRPLYVYRGLDLAPGAARARMPMLATCFSLVALGASALKFASVASGVIRYVQNVR